MSATRVMEYEGRSHRQLTPVGVAGSNHLLLMISSLGEVLGGYDDFLAVYGNDGERALWNIYHRVQPARV
jgi:hypothetical protein